MNVTKFYFLTNSEGDRICYLKQETRLNYIRYRIRVQLFIDLITL